MQVPKLKLKMFLLAHSPTWVHITFHITFLTRQEFQITLPGGNLVQKLTWMEKDLRLKTTFVEDSL